MWYKDLEAAYADPGEWWGCSGDVGRCGMLVAVGCWSLWDVGRGGMLGVVRCWARWDVGRGGILVAVGCWSLWDIGRGGIRAGSRLRPSRPRPIVPNRGGGPQRPEIEM